MAGARAGEDEIARKMNEASAVAADEVGEDECAFDVDGMGHGGVEFARLERTIADTIEDGAKADAIEKGTHAGGVFGVLRDEARRDETPGLMRTDADDLPGEPAL